MRTNRVAGGGYPGRPRFHVNCHPDLVGSLSREFMELKSGKETNYAIGDFEGGFGERQMLRYRGRRGGIEAAPHFPEQAFLNEPGEIVSRNPHGRSVFGADNLMPCRRGSVWTWTP
jgi:hypothetical protein